ncbi:hypothetical protein BJ912DRAFT_1044212 [Pholiota molesta]|nr:hypothetical protein BJ912DRAFT_1044212 [Pholiota molesta]
MPLAPASLTHAIAFLTRPLLPSLAPSTLALLQSALRRTLEAAYVPNRASRLVLAFGGPGAPPPRPVAAACRAAGVAWAAWAPLLLGGVRGAFALVIEPRVVSVAYPASGLVPARSAVVWCEAAEVPRRLAPSAFSAPAHTAAGVDEDTEPHVRISKARVQAASLRATLHSALARSAARTTLAQRLLAVEEEKEADELFAMLSTSVLSPTPTRDAFPASSAIAFSPSTFSPSAEEQAAETSPSSSRSSTPSSFGGSAYDSDAESLTSASSASSFDFLDSTKPSSAVPTTLPAALAIPTPAPAATRPVPAFARRVPAPPAFVPRPSLSTSTPLVTPAPAAAPAAQPVWIDSTKKDVTKYLYQGGVSTVLTGGVMLGGSAAPKSSSTPKPSTAATPRAAAPRPAAVPIQKAAAPTRATAEEVPKYRAPIGSGRWGVPAHRFAPAAGEGSWRRAARV